MRVRLIAALLVFAPSPAVAGEVRVAVAELDNGGADHTLDALGKGLQSMIATDLSAVPGVSLVERQRFGDIVKEQKLARSGYVDPKNAVRMGKLLGATHLVTGSFVVHGAKMRLDVRLFTVKTGTVLAASEATGERDAFFELEKAAVRKMIAALGSKLDAKTRARVARIHTADFEAMLRFSEGIAAFDEERYNDALDKLRAASAKDEDFKLARMTIEEYQSLIAKVRARAAAIQQGTVELKRLELEGLAAEQAEVAKRLIAIAARTGKKHTKARVTALYLLAHAYGGPGPGIRGSSDPIFAELYDASDRFALERAADRFSQRFFYEARELWPAVCPIVDIHHRPPRPRLATFDADFEKQVGWLFGKEKAVDYHRERITRFTWSFDRRLYIDRARRSELYFAMLRDLEAIDPKQPSKVLLEYGLAARRLSGALLLDEAAAIYQRLSAATEDPGRLRGLVSDLEGLEKRKQMLAKAEPGAPLAEVLRWVYDEDTGTGLPDAKKLEALSKRELTDDAKKTLNWARQLPRKQFLLLEDLPVWTLAGHGCLTTGPRSDFLRAKSLRYYGHGERYGHKRTCLATSIVDSRTFEAPTIRATIDHDVPADFWDRDVWPKDGFTPNPAIPMVGFLVGTNDVEHPTRPTTAWAVLLRQGKVELVQVSDPAKRPADKHVAFQGDVVASADVPFARRRNVAIQVRGEQVVVTVDGTVRTLDAKRRIPTGFVGLRLRGNGFAELSGVSVSGK